MIPRTLEPEVMDTVEEAVDYDSMDHSGVNRVFATDFLQVWNKQNPILDVGTGTAQIPIELCRQHQDAHLTAIDAASHMLDLGKKNVERAGFQDRIQLQLCDAKQMPFADAEFAAVISNSIVHHIPNPREVIAEMVRVVRPGGTLFVRDLLRPQSDDEVKRLVQTYAGEENAHQQKMFDDSLRAALTVQEMSDIVVSFGFEATTVQQTTDRHWTWSAIRN